MVQWKHLFAPRQQLPLIKLTQSINRIGTELAQRRDRQFAIAIQSCLALALDRLTDFCSSLCTLNATGNRGVFHTFARQALAMVWDFMETAPMNLIGANWIGGIVTFIDTIRIQMAVVHSGQAQMTSLVPLSRTRHTTTRFHILTCRITLRLAQAHFAE
jgi:putative DNA methylase